MKPEQVGAALLTREIVARRNSRRALTAFTKSTGSVEAASRRFEAQLEEAILDARFDAEYAGADVAEEQTKHTLEKIGLLLLLWPSGAKPKSPEEVSKRARIIGDGGVDEAITRVRAKRLAERARVALLRKMEQVAGDVKAAAASLRARVDTIATTETASAFNAGQALVARGVARVDPFVWSLLAREWCAMLELPNVCGVCWDLDGSIAPPGQAFPSGYEPGSVHPRCRCYYLLVPATPKPTPEEALVSVAGADSL